MNKNKSSKKQKEEDIARKILNSLKKSVEIDTEDPESPTEKQMEPQEILIIEQKENQKLTQLQK